jgi:hypothetical protein
MMIEVLSGGSGQTPIGSAGRLCEEMVCDGDRPLNRLTSDGSMIRCECTDRRLTRLCVLYTVDFYFFTPAKAAKAANRRRGPLAG